VLSRVNVLPVNVVVFPARSVAIILMLANVLSTAGNIRLYNQSLSVPVLIIECNVDRPSLEYCRTSGVGQKFISVPVFHVIVFNVHHWK
jgi:hypothetical protein